MHIAAGGVEPEMISEIEDEELDDEEEEGCVNATTNGNSA